MGCPPSYLSELMKPYIPALTSAEKLLLTDLKTSCKNRGDWAFAAAGPRLWNNHGLHIRSASSLENFKYLYGRLQCRYSTLFDYVNSLSNFVMLFSALFIFFCVMHCCCSC